MLENIGVGIDIVDVHRFKKKHFNNNKSFYKKIFLESEIKYCIKFKSPYQHFAGKFAIKEALKKSIKENIDFLEIETNHLNKKPIVKLLKYKKYNFIISMGHENNVAIAIVISEKLKS